VTAVETENTPLDRGIVMVASPNPFGASTNILFGMPADRNHVKARVFNAQGRLVSTLYDGPLSRGSHTVSWTPSKALPAGAYFFRVESEGGLSTSGKLVVVR
jgi:flagellar hook assembly protein FlgD